MDAIEPLVDFVLDTAPADLPEAVRQLAVEQILDTTATLIAGSSAAGMAALADEVAGWGGTAEATVMLSGLRTTAHNAALVNASMARALDYDDIHIPALGHPSVGVVPVAFAAAELADGVSGEEFIAAVVVGCEVFARLATAPKIGSEESGMSHSYQMGIFAGTAAAARLLGLSKAQLRDAFGLAYSMVSGNQQLLVEPSLIVRVQQGLTAASAITAVRLARRGITASHQVLEGRYGYFKVYHGDGYDRDVIVQDLGTEYHYLKVSRKPYPSCRATHSAIEVGAALRRELGCSPKDVERIRLTVTPVALEFVGVPAHGERWPESGPRRQFSLTANFALGFVNGGSRIADYEEGADFDESELLHVAQAVDVEVDVSLETKHGRRVGPIKAEIRLKDGRETQRELPFASGDPTLPLTPEQIRAKFLDCCEHSRQPIEDTGSLYQSLRAIGDAADVTSILRDFLA